MQAVANLEIATADLPCQGRYTLDERLGRVWRGSHSFTLERSHVPQGLHTCILAWMPASWRR